MCDTRYFLENAIISNEMVITFHIERLNRTFLKFINRTRSINIGMFLRHFRNTLVASSPLQAEFLDWSFFWQKTGNFFVRLPAILRVSKSWKLDPLVIHDSSLGLHWSWSSPREPLLKWATFHLPAKVDLKLKFSWTGRTFGNWATKLD